MSKLSSVPKFLSRRESRIRAMQFLYMSEANLSSFKTSSGILEGKCEMDEVVNLFFKESESADSFTSKLGIGAWKERERTDQLISTYAKNWEFNRIAKVDLAILRLSIYELLHRLDIPPVVSVNEAIELAKRFSDSESQRFINGILDSVIGKLSRPLRHASQK